jgi:metal-sulfur cluster biosynthetic enzyme
MSTAANTASGPALVDEIKAQINAIEDRCSIAAGDTLGLDDMGLVEAVEIGDDGIVNVRIRLTSPTCIMVGLFKAEIEDRVGTLPGVRRVDVVFDGGLDWRPGMMNADARRRRAARLARAQGRWVGEPAIASSSRPPGRLGV